MQRELPQVNFRPSPPPPRPSRFQGHNRAREEAPRGDMTSRLYPQPVWVIDTLTHRVARLPICRHGYTIEAG
jgi:hypothetical protein